MSKPPERTETVSIRMEVRGDAYEKHKESITTLVPDYQDDKYVDKQPDDTIVVGYSFLVTYSNVVRNLRAVQAICDDPDVVVTADCGALEEGRILAYETLKKLDNIIRQVKDRK